MNYKACESRKFPLTTKLYRHRVTTPIITYLMEALYQILDVRLACRQDRARQVERDVPNVECRRDAVEQFELGVRQCHGDLFGEVEQILESLQLRRMNRAKLHGTLHRQVAAGKIWNKMEACAGSVTMYPLLCGIYV